MLVEGMQNFLRYRGLCEVARASRSQTEKPRAARREVDLVWHEGVRREKAGAWVPTQSEPIELRIWRVSRPP